MRVCVMPTGGGGAGMVGTFACPECGAEVQLVGSPGRRVRCARCATLVELPFLPRMAHRPRGVFGPWWLWAGLSLAITAVTVVAIGVHWSEHNRRRAEIAAHLSAADDAERQGQLGRALDEWKQAAELARRAGSPLSQERLRQGADLARRDVLQRLEAARRLDLERSLNALTALRIQVAEDPALRDLEEPVAAVLNAARVQQARTDLAAAQTNVRGGRPAAALPAAARAWAMADRLPPEAAAPLRAAAEQFVIAVASQYGLRTGPVHGQFVLGSPELYDARVRTPLLDALARLGYVAAPADPLWQRIWNEHAPFRLDIQVEEQAVPYLHSANQASRLTAHVGLFQQEREIWSLPLHGQTRIPPRGMPAYEASLAAAAARRNPYAEHRMHADALAALTERLPVLLRTVPPPP